MKADAIGRLIEDWNREYDPSKSNLILAHLRRDVRALNDLARAKLVERGIVAAGDVFRTEDGDRRFAAGDQIVFLKNDGPLGVKNGMIGRIVAADQDGVVAEVGEGDGRRQVDVDQRSYRNIDHGYAGQLFINPRARLWIGSKCWRTLSLDRHLTYVAMTRHREDVALYYGQRSFQKAGGLIPILSQRRAKETTLDYEHRGLYRDALRFAQNRGMHVALVARTLAQDHLRWTLRQGDRLADLGRRLLAVAQRIGVAEGARQNL